MIEIFLISGRFIDLKHNNNSNRISCSCVGEQTLERIGKSSEREAYILMDRIRAPVQTNYLVRPQKEVVLSSVISELGIFGALLGSVPATPIVFTSCC